MLLILPSRESENRNNILHSSFLFTIIWEGKTGRVGEVVKVLLKEIIFVPSADFYQKIVADKAGISFKWILLKAEKRKINLICLKTQKIDFG